MQLQQTDSQQKPKISAKLQQFQDELNSLLDKYQYQLKAEIAVRPEGIIPITRVVDKIPPKENVQTNKFKLSDKEMDKVKKISKKRSKK